MDPDFNPNIAPPKDAAGSSADDSSIPTAAIPGQAAKQPSVSQPGAEPALPAVAGADDTELAGGKNGADPYSGKKPGLAILANKKLLIIVGSGVVLLLILIVVIAASGGSTPVARRAVINTPTQSPLPEVVNRTDGTLDLSRRVDTSAVIHGQKIQASAGQQVNLSSGLSQLVEATGNYASSTTLPSGGKKFIIILLVVGNHALTGNLSTSYLDYKLLDSTGAMLSASPITQQITNNPLGVPVELKPGAQVEGRLIYEVNSQEQGWTLVHKETFQKSSDNTNFTVESNILLNVRSSAAAATPPAASTGSDTSGDASDAVKSAASGN